MATDIKRRGRGNDQDARDSAPGKVAPPHLDTEVAHRLLDPFETLYMGLLRTNDPLLLEKGGAHSGAELYRDLRRDGKVFSALQKRKLALIGRPYQVEPVEQGARGSADAEKLHDILKRSGFDKLCSQLLEALVLGAAISEVVFTWRNGQVEVARAPQRALRRFVFVQEDAGKPPELRLLTRENLITGIPLPDRTFIVHRVNPEDDNPWGTGLGLQLYWAVFFKRKALISWNKLNDRAGVPVPWGKYPAKAGPKEKATLFDALRALSNDGVVMTPEGTMIELLESKLASGQISTQQALCEYCDDWIDAVLLGQEARSKSGGALASASKERADVRLDLVQADADLLSETLNETLIKWLCEMNGFVPCVVSRVVKEEEDLAESAKTDKTVSEMGFELDEETVKARYGEGWRKKAEVPPPVPGAPGVPGVPGVPGSPAAPMPSPAPGPQGAPVPEPAPGPAPVPSTTGAPVQFAERDGPDAAPGQVAIDAAIAAVPDAELQAAMRGLLDPLLAAIEASDSYEDALAAAEAAYPRMDKARLQSLLARAMFGAETFGRTEPDDAVSPPAAKPATL